MCKWDFSLNEITAAISKHKSMISRKPRREAHAHRHRAHRLRRRAFASFGQWQRQVLCERPTSARGGRHLYGHVYARPDRSRSQRRRHRGHFRCRARHRRRGKRLSDHPLRNNDTCLTTSEARVLSGIKEAPPNGSDDAFNL